MARSANRGVIFPVVFLFAFASSILVSFLFTLAGTVASQTATHRETALLTIPVLPQSKALPLEAEAAKPNQVPDQTVVPERKRPRFDYSQMTFYLSVDANKTFFDTMTPQVMQRSWMGTDTTCKLGLAPQFCVFLQRLDSGRCVSVYALGGSTTLGISASGKLWYQQLEAWLNLHLPCEGGGKHRIRAHAYSGAGSSHHLANIPTLTAKFKAMGTLDLILLEIGANDFVVSEAPQTEALVYSLAAVQPRAAFMTLSSVPKDLEGNLLPAHYEDTPEAKIHFPISNHLHLPFVSIPLAVLKSPAKSGNASSNLYAEGSRDPTSPLFQGGRQCGKCLIYPDGYHMSASGHALLASAIVMLWLDMMPRVEGVAVSDSPIDVVALTNHTLFPQAKALTETRPPLLVRSFMESSPPAGFTPPEGWTFVNERERFGLAAFGKCNQSRAGELDPCSKPLPIDIGGYTLVLGFLGSYATLGIALVKAPPGLVFDVCEVPLAVPNSTCVIDGIFSENFPWHVSLPAHARMHLIPKNNQSKVKFPLNLQLHVASPALASKLTPSNSTFYNATGQRALQPPLRGNHKFKIHGWYSLA